MNSLRKTVAEYGVDVDLEESDAARLAGEHSRQALDQATDDLPDVTDLFRSKAYGWINGVLGKIEHPRSSLREQEGDLKAEIATASAQAQGLKEEVRSKERLVEETAAIASAAASGPHWWVRQVPTPIYIVVLAVIGVFSYLQNSSAFELFVDRPQAVGGAAGFAALELFATHGVGHGLALPRRSRTSFLLSLLLLVVILVAVVVIGFVRFDYLSATGEASGVWQWPLLQFFVVATGLFTSHHHANEHADAYAQAKKDLEDAISDLDAAESAVRAMEAEARRLREAAADVVYERLVVAWMILEYVPTLVNSYKLAFFTLARGRLPRALRSQADLPPPPPLMVEWVEWLNGQGLDRPQLPSASTASTGVHLVATGENREASDES